MKLRIGHLSTFYHTAILLMAREELSRMLGFEPEWKLYPTGPAIVDDLRRGNLDLAYVGLPPAMIGIASGVPIKCIAGGHMEGTVLIGKSGDRGYPGATDLGEILIQFRGRKIGVPGTGTIHHVILASCLEQYQLTDFVEVVHFPWADEIVESLKKGRVDAAVGTPALCISAKRFTHAKLLLPASELWPSNPSYGIVAAQSLIDRERDLLVNFLEVHEDATHFIRRLPREAARVISRFFGLVDEEFVMDTFRVSPKYCGQLSLPFVESTLRFVPTMKALGFINRDLTGDDIFDRTLIAAAHGPGDHYRNGINLCREHHLFHPSHIELRPPRAAPSD